MKAAIILLLILTFTPQCFSQFLYAGPEGVVFDSVGNRYLVANATSGTIVEVDMEGNQSLYMTGLNIPLGLHIDEDRLFVSTNDPNLLIGMDLQTAEVFLTINIPSAVGLNGIAIDSNGYLYLVDQIGKIYKIDLEEETYSTFISHNSLSGLQGILYDEDDNRLIAVTFPLSSAVYGVCLAESTVSVIAYTSIGRFTGICGDEQGNIYASSWRTNRVYRWDSEFENPPEVFSSGHDQPTGICCNNRDNIFVVSNYGSNTVDFIPMTTSIEGSTAVPSDFMNSKCYPNPFNMSTQIEYSLESKSFVEISVYDLLGRKLETLVDTNQPAGRHQLNWDAEGLSSGVYFYTIQAGDIVESKRMTLLK